MTDCARALGMLAQFVDNDLAMEQAAWLKTHVAGCAGCSAALAGVEKIDSQLIAWGQYLERQSPPPAGAREELAARMVTVPVRRQVTRWIPAAAAAAVIAAAVGLMPIAPRRTLHAVDPAPARFVRIPYLPPLDPQENTTIVRMDIRVATLIAVGYRVAADPEQIVSAEVLVGEDGRAQAVRVLSDIDWNGTGD